MGIVKDSSGTGGTVKSLSISAERSGAMPRIMQVSLPPIHHTSMSPRKIPTNAGPAMKQGPSLRTVLCFAGIASASPASAAGVIPLIDITVPPQALNGDMQGANRIPFDPSYPFSSTFTRYQQAFSSSYFNGFHEEPFYITAMKFRPDGQSGAVSGPFNAVISDIQIELSTTSSQPDLLHHLFSANTGADVAVVLPRGPLALSSDYILATNGAREFDIVIEFATPFLYDPSLGHLLLDVTNHSGDRFTAVNWISFDATSADNDGISRVTASSPATASGSRNTIGLVAQFVTVPIPEPSVAALAALAAFAGLTRRGRPAR